MYMGVTDFLNVSQSDFSACIMFGINENCLCTTFMCQRLFLWNLLRQKE